MTRSLIEYVAQMRTKSTMLSVGVSDDDVDLGGGTCCVEAASRATRDFYSSRT